MKRITLLALLLFGCSTITQKERDFSAELFALLHQQGFAGTVGKLVRNGLYIDPEGIRNGLFIDTKVNGYDLPLLVDTGATRISIGMKQAQQLHLRTSPEALTENYLHQADAFEVAGFTIQNWPVYAAEHSKAVIGTEFLDFSNAIILCPYGTVMFNTDQKASAELGRFLSANGFEAANITVKSGIQDGLKAMHLYANLEIDGSTGTFLIDTGAFDTVIDKAFFSDRDPIQKPLQVSRLMGAARRHTQMRRIKSQNVYLGGVKAKGQSFQVVEKVESKRNARTFGKLGFDFLVTNNAIIDIGNRLLYLNPNLN